MSFSICGMIPIMETTAIEISKPKALNESVINAMVIAINNGLSISTACDKLKLSLTSMYRWLREGESDETETSLQWKLWQSVKAARAGDIERHLLSITEHSKTTWQASAWVLERLYGFRKPPDIQVTVNNNEPIPQAISSQSTSELESLLASLRGNDDDGQYGFKVLPSGDS